MEKKSVSDLIKDGLFYPIRIKKCFKNFTKFSHTKKRNFKNKEEGMELEKKEEINKTIIL